MVGDRKRLTDLPEHSLEEIVSLIVKNKKDLNKFFGFGLSSKLFYKSTLHVLDQHDIYFPMDMGQSAKSKSNLTMMRYMAQYDSVSKGKFGLRFVTKRRAPEPSHSGCKCCGDGTMGDGRIIEWLNECKCLRKIYFDKIDVSMPIIQLAFQRLIYQNHTSIQVFKFENDPNYTNAIENDFFNRCIRGCENLKELTVVWNLKNGMDQRDSFRFLKGVFKVLDNMPGLEALHIVVPWIDGKPQPLPAGDMQHDTRFYKTRDITYENFGFKYIIIDAQLRFYYEPTIWLGNDDDDIPQIVKCKELGAAGGANYKIEEWDEKIKELAGDPGVNVVLDCVGSSYWKQNVNVLSQDGRWTLYGLMGGPKVDGPLLAMMLRKRLRLEATTLRSRSIDYKKELTRCFSEHALDLFRNGRYKVILDKKSFLLEDAQGSHDYMETNGNIGKVILQVAKDEES